MGSSSSKVMLLIEDIDPKKYVFPDGEEKNKLCLKLKNPEGLECSMKKLSISDKQTENIINNLTILMENRQKLGKQVFAPSRISKDENDYFVEYPQVIEQDKEEEKKGEDKNKKKDKEEEDEEKEKKKNLARQFYFILLHLKEKKIHYISSNPLENSVITKQNKLIILGLEECFSKEYDFKEVQNNLVKKFTKGKLGEYSDLVVLACFVYKLLTDEDLLKENNIDNPFDDEAKKKIDELFKDEKNKKNEENEEDAKVVKDFIEKCLEKDEKKREEFNVLESDYLKKEMPVKYDTEEQKISIDEFSFGWKDGEYKVSIKDNEFGYNSKESCFSINSGEANISIGKNGFSLSSEVKEKPKTIIDPKQLVVNFKSGKKNPELEIKKIEVSVEINGDGATFTNKYVEGKEDKVVIDGNGFSSNSVNGDTLAIGKEGVVFQNTENGHLKIGNEIDCNIDGYENKGTSYKANGIEINIGTGGMSIKFGEVHLNVSKGLKLNITKNVLVKITAGIEIKIGDNISFVINGDGLSFDIGDLSLKINKSGISFSACGFTIKIGKGGIQIFNGNSPFDFKTKGIEFALENIPLLDISVPSIPSPNLPPIPKPPTPKFKFPFC